MAAADGDNQGFCASTLSNSLSSARQEEQERAIYLQGLLQKASEAGLKLVQNVPYDGDCFFHSVLSLNTQVSGSDYDAASLRSNLVDFFQSERCPAELKDFTTPGFLSNLAIAHKDVEETLAVRGLVEILGQSIRAFSYDPVEEAVSDITYRSLIRTRSIHTRPVVIIGHIKDKRFVPLKSREPFKRPAQPSVLDSFIKKSKATPTVVPVPVEPAGPDVGVSSSATHTPLEPDENTTSAVMEESSVRTSPEPPDPPSAHGVTGESSVMSPEPPAPVSAGIKANRVNALPTRITCDALCCHEAVAPYQPHDDDILQKTKKTYVVKNKVKTRQLRSDWFKEYKWLHFCHTTLKVYCFHCMKIKPKGDDCKQQTYFSDDGFDNWKKAGERFASHEKSTSHKAAVGEVNKPAKDNRVDSRVLMHNKSVQLTRRQSLINQLKAIRFLMRQGLSARGHSDENGNLFQLLKCLGEEKWLAASDYLSPQIVNEQIKLMSLDVLRKCLAEIKQARFFSVMADETRDCSNREQLVLCIRWVGKDYEVCEETVGLIQVPDTKADTLLAVIKDALVRLTLDPQDCRGQAYDGASNFQGRLSGVATQLQKEFPAALPVHCLAHCVNLCLQGSVRSVKPLRDALDFAMEIIQLITASPKRQVLFENIKADKGENATGIRPLCPTRWTVKGTAMKSLLDNYDSLQETMEIVASGYDDYARKASGLLVLMQQFRTYFGLKLALELFTVMETLSVSLQAKHTTCHEASESVELTIRCLTRMRSDECFADFYEGVCTAAREVCDPPTLPRRRIPPARRQDGSLPHVFSNVQDYYRQQFFEGIDLIVQDLKRRFDQKTFGVIKAIEQLIVMSAGKQQQVDIPDTIAEKYGKDVEMSKLKTQLSMLSDVEGLGQHGVSMQTVIHSLRCQPGVRKLLSEVDTLLRIYLTSPVTTSTAERTFSILRRTKTYLRATMTQQRLNHCLILHAHKDRTDQIDLHNIAKQFVDVNNRRGAYFGEFSPSASQAKNG